MPVVDKEPHCWPVQLLDDEQPAGGRWSVLHVLPRNEKVVARQLRRDSLRYFLPFHEKKKVYQRRTVRSQLPLFPGYVFVHGDEEAVHSWVSISQVIRCLQVDDQKDFETSIRRVYGLLNSGAPVTPESRLQPGMLAEIVGGPLTGYRGRVLRKGKNLRFVVEVDFLQQGASVEVDEAMIAAL
ncbi:MAG: transcription termination/antitermination NusG family protein [Maioricimonas sp. JB049]